MGAQPGDLAAVADGGFFGEYVPAGVAPLVFGAFRGAAEAASCGVQVNREMHWDMGLGRFCAGKVLEGVLICFWGRRAARASKARRTAFMSLSEGNVISMGSGSVIFRDWRFFILGGSAR